MRRRALEGSEVAPPVPVHDQLAIQHRSGRELRGDGRSCGALHAFHYPIIRTDQILLPGVGYHPRHAQRAWRDVVELLAECLPVSE